jgi:hypothetical protein
MSDDKPWRDDPMFGEVDGEAWDRLDALCQRAYVNGQAYEANAQWAQLPRLKAAEARADRLAAALRRAQHSMHYTATKGHRGVAEVCDEAGCAQARAALADDGGTE